MVVVPVAAPREMVVAAPPMLRVVTPDCRRLKEAAEEVKSPPLTATSPVVVRLSAIVTSLSTAVKAVTFPGARTILPVVALPKTKLCMAVEAMMGEP